MFKVVQKGQWWRQHKWSSAYDASQDVIARYYVIIRHIHLCAFHNQWMAGRIFMEFVTYASVYSKLLLYNFLQSVLPTWRMLKVER